MKSLRKTSPVALFTYCRPEHTRRTVESLACNNLAKDTDLIIYSDGPKTEAESALVIAVRDYLDSISGFRSISVVIRQQNMGLANSIISGVTEVLQRREKIIVLEDDMVTSPHFLTYMNEALDFYANDERVVSVHGYIYPVRSTLPETFFLRGADCWGWATWRRGWELFNPNGRYLLDELRRQKLVHEFDFNGTYDYSGMLEGQIAGKNDSWAIRWYASAFLQGKLTLYPSRSLVYNIGNDTSGTHCGYTISHDVKLSMTPIRLGGVNVEQSKLALGEFERFFRNQNRGGAINHLLRSIRAITRSCRS